MIVGFDVGILRRGASTGTALYAYNLARALLRNPGCERLVLYMGTRKRQAGAATLDELESLGAEVTDGGRPRRWLSDGAWWLPLAGHLPPAMRDVDVFHAGEFFFPNPDGIPVVATVHDLSHALFPKMHTGLNRALHARRLRWIDRNATRVITVSAATRNDLLKRGGLDPARVTTVHEARGHAEVPPQSAEERRRTLDGLGIGEHPYILCVATLEPRKNHARLVAAFESLPDRHRNLRLVLAGGRGWHSGPVLERVRTSTAQDRILITGRLPAAALRAVYEGATAFAYPSLYEGFGLPVLEAMAAGVPVLTADRSSLPEVAGDAALLVDPESVEAIAAGLLALLDGDDLRADLAEAGRRREAGFSWDRAAEGTLSVYRNAIEEARGESSLGRASRSHVDKAIDE